MYNWFRFLYPFPSTLDADEKPILSILRFPRPLESYALRNDMTSKNLCSLFFGTLTSTSEVYPHMVEVRDIRRSPDDESFHSLTHRNREIGGGGFGFNSEGDGGWGPVACVNRWK